MSLIITDGSGDRFEVVDHSATFSLRSLERPGDALVTLPSHQLSAYGMAWNGRAVIERGSGSQNAAADGDTGRMWKVVWIGDPEFGQEDAEDVPWDDHHAFAARDEQEACRIALADIRHAEPEQVAREGWYGRGTRLAVKEHFPEPPTRVYEIDAADNPQLVENTPGPPEGDSTGHGLLVS